MSRTDTPKRVTTRDTDGVRVALEDGRPFVTSGALAGVTGATQAGTPFAADRLPDDWRRTYTARRALITYTVSSYATPIAWHDREAGWIMPDARYSVTTTKHQSTIRGALSRMGVTYLV